MPLLRVNAPAGGPSAPEGYHAYAPPPSGEALPASTALSGTVQKQQRPPHCWTHDLFLPGVDE